MLFIFRSLVKVDSQNPKLSYRFWGNCPKIYEYLVETFYCKIITQKALSMNLLKVYYKIDKPKNGRRFAVGDIHGCAKTFRKLVIEELELTKTDQLFLLGDYIDKGPDSKGVLDFIMELLAEGFQIFPIRGNHEQMLLESVENDNPRVFEKILRLNKIRNLADENGEVYPKYLVFLRSLKYYVILDDFYLVHAGVDFSKENIFADLHKILWVRPTEFDAELANRKLNGKKVIHGHTPISIEAIQHQIENREQFICLDNGCCDVFRKRRSFAEREIGMLCALDLDSFELFEVGNTDSVRRIRKL
jgi:serine/threonine protein phosphatase 1